MGNTTPQQETTMTTGEKIRSRRRALNTLTLERVAEELGYSVSHIADIETGKVSPRLEELQSLAAALGCTAVSLIGDES